MKNIGKIIGCIITLCSVEFANAGNYMTKPAADIAVTLLGGLPAERTPSVETDTMPTNATVALEFQPNREVINYFYYMLDLTGSTPEPGQYARSQKDAYLHKICTALSNYIKAIEAPGYVRYLNACDGIRQTAKSTQEMTASFMDAYTSNQPDVDLANRYLNSLKLGFNTLFSYESLVKILGDGSEIKLQKKLVPLLKIAKKFLNLS